MLFILSIIFFLSLSLAPVKTDENPIISVYYKGLKSREGFDRFENGGKIEEVDDQEIGLMTGIREEEKNGTNNVDVILPATNLRNKRSQLDDLDVVEILKIHNFVRSKERASNMLTMVYNKDLEQSASAFASTCDFARNEISNETTTPQFFYQNLYAVMGQRRLNITRAVLVWASAKKYYNVENGTCAAGQQCTRFAALIRHNANEVGCSHTICPKLKSTDFNNSVFFVCNYGPIDNFTAGKPYEIGEACSQCPPGYKCKDQLCSKLIDSLS